MNSEESKNRFISSSEAKEKSRSAYYKLLESAREGNRNLTLLMDYASKLRVTKTLEKYLEIKL